jgi:hypothetical protein
MNSRQIHHVILLFLLSHFVSAQQDTLFTKSNRIIPCTIMNVGLVSLEYREKSDTLKHIDLFQLRQYSQNGARKLTRSRINELNKGGIKDTVNVGEELAHLRYCLSKFHTQYTTGLSISLVGGALAGSSFFITKDATFRQQLGIGGVVILLAGLGCSMDAHRWLGKAGWGVSGKGSNVEIHYRFN